MVRHTIGIRAENILHQVVFFYTNEIAVPKNLDFLLHLNLLSNFNFL